MYNFENITPTNGFDTQDLINARQNNYAWSMSELGEYIYVGTGRNILLTVISTIFPSANLPISIDPIEPDYQAEIWRYKKDGTQPWERVFKTEDPGIYGFRFMINFAAFGGFPALYAAGASVSGEVIIYKSVNGVDWKAVSNEVKPSGTIQGTSSRAMVVHHGKLYLATVDESGAIPDALLYSSKDPEFYPWELETKLSSTPGYDPDKNPQGNITNMEVFNKRIYVATSAEDGIQVWRTDSEEPRFNDWTLIVDKGFGDESNKYSLAIGVFKNYLYVSGTKELPLSWAIPRGCDIIRIDKQDNWELVVGGIPFEPAIPTNGERGKSISGLWSGFNNPFNVYAWQIKEYKGKLYITTFDDSTNMQVILELILANREAVEMILGKFITSILIKVYTLVVEVLALIDYPFGFDMYVSNDGKKFKPLFLNGLCNRYNYGGRMLYVDCENDLYLGTANPFQGLEVYKYDSCNNYCECDCSNHNIYKEDKHFSEKYLEVSKEIEQYFDLLTEHKSEIEEMFNKLLNGRRFR